MSVSSVEFIALVLLLGAAVFLNYVDRGAVGIAAPKLCPAC